MDKRITTTADALDRARAGEDNGERRALPEGFPTQAQVLAWVAHRWPDRTTPIWRAGKLCEEAGEVIGAVIKMDEGRKTAHDVRMETAQTVICAMGVAESVGFDLWEAVAEYGPISVKAYTPEGYIVRNEAGEVIDSVCRHDQPFSTCPKCPGGTHEDQENATAQRLAMPAWLYKATYNGSSTEKGGS